MSAKYSCIMISLGLIFIIGCSKPTEPSSPLETRSYVVWNEGDMRQIIIYPDSATAMLRVLHSVKRDDGIILTALEETIGTGSPDTSYCYSKNGYYTASTRVRGTDAKNPYSEQVLGKDHPTNGERWNLGIEGFDSSYGLAQYFPTYNTRIKLFSDVYGFSTIVHQGNRIDTVMTVYYALGIGYIGIESNFFNAHSQLTYVKVGNSEFGQMVPAKDASPHIVISSKNALRQNAEHSMFGIKH